MEKLFLRFINAQMDIIVELYGGLAHILEIIQNKYCWVTLCRAGVLGKHCLFSSLLVLKMILYSCQGENNDLDGHLSELPRTRNLTEFLIAKYRVGILWDKFGIVSDVVVSIPVFNWTSTDVFSPHLLYSHSQMTSSMPIFMSFSLQICFIN